MLKLKKMKPLTKLTQKARRDEHSYEQCLIEAGKGSEIGLSPTSKKTQVGLFAVYVGEERQRFMVPTSFLSHPLFKILLDKARDQFGFQHDTGIVFPCSVSTFQEVVNAVQANHGRFDMTKFFQELSST